MEPGRSAPAPFPCEPAPAGGFRALRRGCLVGPMLDREFASTSSDPATASAARGRVCLSAPVVDVGPTQENLERWAEHGGLLGGVAVSGWPAGRFDLRSATPYDGA